jgi:hypothetical protein
MIRISWAYAPVIAIGMAAVANLGIIVAGGRVRPQPVEDRPWLASVTFDERKAAEGRFAASGMRLSAEPEPGGLRFRLAGAPLTDARLELYRPDDRALDHVVAWPDTTRPLPLALARAGLWRARLTGTTADGPVAAELLSERP